LKLTTHVLDVARGRPAAGVAIVVVRVAEDGIPTTVAEVRTDDDGRTAEPLVEGDELVPGRYELTFAVGDHFAATGAVEPGTTPYLDLVPVHVHIGADTGSVHVALLVTPWSYSTYRGS
jgi:hydroxyisourate hydrolase